MFGEHKRHVPAARQKIWIWNFRCPVSDNFPFQWNCHVQTIPNVKRVQGYLSASAYPTNPLCPSVGQRLRWYCQRCRVNPIFSLTTVHPGTTIPFHTTTSPAPPLGPVPDTFCQATFLAWRMLGSTKRLSAPFTIHPATVLFSYIRICTHRELLSPSNILSII